jgi:hypothetical protein
MERTHEDSLAGVDSSIGDDLPKDAIGKPTPILRLMDLFSIERCNF